MNRKSESIEWFCDLFYEIKNLKKSRIFWNIVGFLATILLPLIIFGTFWFWIFQIIASILFGCIWFAMWIECSDWEIEKPEEFAKNFGMSSLSIFWGVFVVMGLIIFVDFAFVRPIAKFNQALNLRDLKPIKRFNRFLNKDGE